MNDPSVGLSVGLSVCPVHCGKTADRIRMLFGIIGWTGPGMRHVVWFGVRSTGRGTFGANLGRAFVHRDLYGVRVLQRRDAALLPNYFGQTCFYSRGERFSSTTASDHCNLNVKTKCVRFFTIKLSDQKLRLINV